MTTQPKIKNCLWFDEDAEEAVNHYMAAFKDSKITPIARYGDAGPGPEGQEFMALNGGPMFKPNEAVSLVVTCEDQAEVDRLWDHLLKGGSPSSAAGLRTAGVSPGRSRPAALWK